jgi:5-methylcytosine-specific restriction endonuclease McrA
LRRGPPLLSSKNLTECVWGFDHAFVRYEVKSKSYCHVCLLCTYCIERGGREPVRPLRTKGGGSRTMKGSRGRLAHAYKRQCVYCGVQGGARSFTVDHVVPVGRGGDHHLSNMVLACDECNQEKGDMTLQEWKGWDRPPYMELGIRSKRALGLEVC